MRAAGLTLRRDPEETAPRLVELLHPPLPVHERERERAAVHHRARPLGGRAGAAHGLGQLEPPGDVSGDRREVLQVHEAERWRLVRVRAQVADDADRPLHAASRAQRSDDILVFSAFIDDRQILRMGAYTTIF